MNNNNNNENNMFIDLNKHQSITKYSCIHLQKFPWNSTKPKRKFIYILKNYGEGEYYAHIFNPNYSNFPACIHTITIDTYNTHLSDLRSYIVFDILSVTGNYTSYSDNDFYVFIAKDYNSKLELIL